MQPVESAVIAAAGLGSRLGLGLPKCMLEIEGATLLSRLVSLLEVRVSTIHVVVGYREELVIDHCARHHPNIVIVRNPDFRSTNTAYSFAQGARYLRGKCIFLDGDLVIAPESLDLFLTSAASTDILVGLCAPTSDNAVFATASQAESGLVVQGFSRDQKTNFEWANIVTGSPRLLDGAAGYVFEHLKQHLPVPGQLVDISEIDTAADLERTQAFIRQRGL